MKTVLRRRIAKRGVRPRVETKSVRKGYSLYGAVEASTGTHFFSEGARMNTDGFQDFINRFSERYPLDFHVLQVDRAIARSKKFLYIQGIEYQECFAFGG